MEIKLPKYFKYTVILLGLILLLYILQQFKSVLMPLAFSALFALLLLPVSVRLERMRVPRPLAILICLILIVLILASVGWFIGVQFSSFTSELSNIAGKLNQLLEDVQLYLQDRFGIAPTDRSALINQAIQRVQEQGSAYVGRTISITTGALTILTLLPIFIFCLLYYRDHFREFMFKFVTKDKRGHVMHTVDNIQQVAQGYLSGLMIVILIVALLNTFGLLLMGVKHAVFFGVFAAILTIIPYIGIFIGALLPAIYVLVIRTSVVDALLVVGIFAFVQFLEGNFITPFITGSKVRINPFAAILALLIGGEIWGPAGMILSIPVIAILKVLFDAYPPLEPFGFLLCDISETPNKPGFIHKLKKKVIKNK